MAGAAMTSIEPFQLHVPDAVLDDLRRRLTATRWPDRETVPDWSQGARLERVRELCEYWATTYDWRRCERRLNEVGQFRTSLDGLSIHFLHVRSKAPAARALLLTHGWPGSVVEFLEVIGPLVDPVFHGGRTEDAFDVVVPSLPGFGFSEKPVHAGWTVPRIAAAWIELMERLGYERFFAQGGDWGAAVTMAIGSLQPPGCAGIHLNAPPIFPTEDDLVEVTAPEQEAIEAAAFYEREDSGYAHVQGTRPQTIAYALTDSPAGQAAWIYDKFQAWSDNAGDPESALSRDLMLDNIMLYWLPANAGSAARLYWESGAASLKPKPVALPVGITLYPREIFRPSRRWASRIFPKIQYWSEALRGGHFAAMEQPELFVQEMRNCFAGR